MTLDKIHKMVQDLKASGQTPETLILTPDDAKALKLPNWTKQFLGMKVIIAQNWPQSQVVPHKYETVTMRKTDEKVLKEYKEEIEQKRLQ